MNEFCPIPRWELLRRELKNLEPEEFKAIAASDPDIVVFDVRTVEEYEQGRICGAQSLDYFASDFLDRLLSLDPEKTYFVYCGTGRRSVRVCTLMRNAGLPHVFHLHGGLNAWKRHFAEKSGSSSGGPVFG